MSDKKPAAFVRTPHGVKIIIPKASVTLTFVEIGNLNSFIASGEKASNSALRRSIERNSGHLEAMTTAALENELERRAALGDDE